MNTLPFDVLFLIFQECDASSLLSLAQTCKRLSNDINKRQKPNIWEFLWHRDFRNTYCDNYRFSYCQHSHLLEDPCLVTAMKHDFPNLLQRHLRLDWSNDDLIFATGVAIHIGRVDMVRIMVETRKIDFEDIFNKFFLEHRNNIGSHHIGIIKLFLELYPYRRDVLQKIFDECLNRPPYWSIDHGILRFLIRAGVDISKVTPENHEWLKSLFREGKKTKTLSHKYEGDV